MLFEFAGFAIASKDFLDFCALSVGSVFSVRFLVGLFFFLLRVSSAFVSVSFALLKF